MNNNCKNKIYFNEDSCGNIIDNKTTRKRIINAKSKKDSDNKMKNIIFNNNYNGNIVNSPNNNSLSKDKNCYFYSLGNSPLNTNNQNENIYNGIKNDLIIEELNKKKDIIIPIGKEINSNINANGYDVHRGCLTSRASNNVSKNKYKGINIGQENNYYNKEFKIKAKNKSIKKTKNNLISRNENNPVKIKRLYDNIQNNNNDENPKITGYFTSRNK